MFQPCQPCHHPVLSAAPLYRKPVSSVLPLQASARFPTITACQTLLKHCATHVHALQDSDENKLIYTDLFARYTSLVESTIESRLKEAVPGFSMAEFSSLLETHKDNLMSDVFDLLLSMGDFESFKEVMLSYKREVEDGRSSFGVHCTPLKIHTQVGCNWRAWHWWPKNAVAQNSL